MLELPDEWARILRELVAGRVDITINIVHNGGVETPQSQGLTLKSAHEQALTIDDWVDDWAQRRIQDGKTERHVNQVARYVRACARRNDWTLPAQMHEQGVRLWLMELKGRGGNKPPSAHLYNNALGSMKTFCRFLKRNRVIKENPCDFIEGRPKDEVDEGYRAITVEELVTLINTAQMRRGGEEAADVYLFTFWTGLRRSEVKALKGSNVILHAEQPRIDWRPKETKGGRRTGRVERIPLFDSLVIDIVRRRLRGPDDRIFPIVPRQDVFKRDAERAGLELENTAGKLVFHSLRKGLATALAMADVPTTVTQTIMRHRQIQTTNRVYVDKSLMPTAQALRSTYEKIWTSQPKKLLTLSPIPDRLCVPKTSGDHAMVKVATTPASGSWRESVTDSSPVSPIPSGLTPGSRTQTNSNLIGSVAGPVATGHGAAVSMPASGPTADAGFRHLSLSSAVPSADPAGMVFAQDQLAECDGGLIYLGSASGALPGVVPPQGSALKVDSSGAVSGVLPTGSVDPAFSVPSGAASDWIGGVDGDTHRASGYLVLSPDAPKSPTHQQWAAGSTPARSTVSPPSPASGAAGRAGLSDSDSALMREAVKVIARLLVRLDGGG